MNADCYNVVCSQDNRSASERVREKQIELLVMGVIRMPPLRCEIVIKTLSPMYSSRHESSTNNNIEWSVRNTYKYFFMQIGFCFLSCSHICALGVCLSMPYLYFAPNAREIWASLFEWMWVTWVLLTNHTR
jgi:hypothetical protein